MTLEELAKELDKLGVSKRAFNIICTAFILKNELNISTREANDKIKQERIKIGWDTKDSVTEGIIEQNCTYFPSVRFYSGIKEFALAVRNNELISDYYRSIKQYPAKKHVIEKLIKLLNTYVFGNNKETSALSNKPKDKFKKSIILEELVNKLDAKGVGKRFFNLICIAFILKNNDTIATRNAVEAIRKERIRIGWNSEEDNISGRIEQDSRYFPVNNFYKGRSDFAIAVRTNQLLSDYQNSFKKHPEKQREVKELIDLLKEYVFNEKDKSITSKTNEDIQKLYDLKKSFLDEWPIERLKTMTLGEYTNLDKKTSFCYWLETITTDIGGISGGSAYKFGIFKRKDLESDNYNKRRRSDGEYAWYGKYGNTKEEVFENIRKVIINIATFSQQNKLKEIDEIDLGDAVKWKIAFLYSDFNIINIFNKDSLKRVVLGLGLELPESQSISELNQLILKQKPKEEDFFEYSIRVWDAYGIENDKAKEFEKWLKAQKTTNSGMISSYLRAINILINHFEIAVYEEDDIEILNDLYEDLKLNQKDTNGKYYYAKAKSYGEGGFYSAAIKLYIDFLNQDHSSDDNTFIESINNYSNEELQFYFNHLDEIVSFLNLEQGDNRVVYSCKELFLNLNIGQRIAWRLDPRKGQKYHIMTDELIDDTSGKFDGEPEHFYHIFNDESEIINLKESSLRACTAELVRTKKSGYKRHNNTDFERAVFDKSFREQFIKTETMAENNTVLNKILFGPPGTGKTYNTVNESLKIVDPDFYKTNEFNRDILNQRFKELLIKKWDNTSGQIAFCTFHQSFSYEDFVEGIKPKMNENKEVFYEIEDGVFKNICQLAESSISATKMKKESKLTWSDEQFNLAEFYKISLGNSNDVEDRSIYENCIENNCIAIGYGDEHNFQGMTQKEISKKCDELGYSEHAQERINYFIHYLKNGNYVLISKGNSYVRAIGKVIGDYEFDPNSPIRYNHFRKVEWLVKDENIPINELYDRNLNQKTIYKIDKEGLNKTFFVNHKEQKETESKKVKDYVLIVDEINRGNVSSIFGELITLIEKDKRAGAKEELEVTLPYSKDPFKVPQNVYIIGTMNTADRSIEALDTALRRRFSFKEMPPKPKLILTEGQSGEVNGVVDDVNLKDLLETINKRIEKLIDKDHRIGHSYFLKVKDLKSLKSCFKNEVIPLLEEYFFGDYGKIGLVLGDSFVTKDDIEVFEFAKFEGYDSDVSSDLKERSVYKIRTSKDWDFNAI